MLAARTLASSVLLCLVVVFGLACRSEAAQPTPAPGEASAPAAAGESAPATEVAQAEAPAPDRYPQLLFGRLAPAERTRFVGLAEAELCPCEGGPRSLDACLRDANDGCELALQSASIMFQMIQQGSDDVEVLDGAQTYVRNARRVHSFQLDGAPWKGAENPSVVIVEFADFQCPACREVGNLLGELLPEFRNDLRIYYKQFPLPSHPNASQASIAALAAHRQGQFWAYHDRIFANQSRLNQTNDPMPLLLGWADEVGLDRERFTRDLADPALRQQVEAEIAEGTAAGLMGTPTLYMNGVQVMDAYSREALRARIQGAIAAAARP